MTVRQGLLEELEPLCCEFRIEERQSGYVPAWPRKARDDTRSQSIADDRTRRSGIVVVACLAAKTPGVPWVTITSTLSRSEVIVTERRKSIVVAVRPAVLDDKIPSLQIAELQPFAEAGDRSG